MVIKKQSIISAFILLMIFGILLIPAVSAVTNTNNLPGGGNNIISTTKRFIAVPSQGFSPIKLPVYTPEIKPSLPYFPTLSQPNQTNPMSTPDQIPILFNGVIYKTKDISIAKNYCNIIAFRTTAKLDWLFSLEPTDPVWVVTMYGKEIIDNKPGKTVTKVVKINGYTGAVISVN